jgi:hypothetical protein
MADVIEDIIGMESSFKEEGTDSLLLMQRTVSVSRPKELNETEMIQVSADIKEISLD